MLQITSLNVRGLSNFKKCRCKRSGKTMGTSYYWNLEFPVRIVNGGDFSCPLNPLLDKKGDTLIPHTPLTRRFYFTRQLENQVESQSRCCCSAGRLHYRLTSSYLFDTGSGVWKLNVLLLLNKDYNEVMKRNILIWSSEPKSNFDNSQMPWD
ncbi:unnamed protein product [Pocillopora meandrina]|uniref:Uncharacterized protein n=1 Tax=Pocillopora meandrina TaxID=46732 RepID=A0AAU9XAC8_9CNID|nr:unnamed protein product [Pocillopora meandrina]